MESSRRLLARVSPSITRCLGYRRSSSPKPLPSYGIALWSFIAAFCGISVIQATFQSDYFAQRGVPSVIASYGASAVLIYGSIDSPLAQPRALIGGHFIGALLGISISELFQLLPPGRYYELQWLAGSLAVSLTIVVMQFTRTVHPPAGATALLAVVNQEVAGLSWYLLPVILLSSTLALAVALVINNIQRRYPVHIADASPPATPPPATWSGHEDGKVDSSHVTLDDVDASQRGIP